MGWYFLIVAGLFEIIFAYCLKESEGFTRIWPIVGFVIGAIVSFCLLTKAMETIPLGTAYAVWTGIGTVGTAVLGIIVFGDSFNFGRIFFITTLIISVMGLNFCGGAATQ